MVYISFEAKPVRNCLIIKIENNTTVGGYKKGQGLGLPSIRKLCEKYGGRMKVSEDGGLFQLSIILGIAG